MDDGTERWKDLTETQFGWEREALDFVKRGLPDCEPYRAWANFEFLADDGSINEVDLLVLTPKGFFLVEIKSWPGQITGDAGSWTWRRQGRATPKDNPLFLANRKAKKLKSLLERQKAVDNVRVPFLDALVFLSAPDLDVKLDESGRQRVTVRDPAPGRKPGVVPGILHALRFISPEEYHRRGYDPVNAPTAKAIARALEQAGVRSSTRSRRVADYVLERLLFEGPGYQDFEAVHSSLKNVRRRVRLYGLARAATPEARDTIKRAARREFEILEGVRHAGVLRAELFTEAELGPALVFEHDPDALRLDQFLAAHGGKLDYGARLGLLRQIGEALAYAHSRRLVHRALGPQSILVRDGQGPSPRVQIFNWQAAARTSERPSTSRSRTGTVHPDELVEAAAHAYMAPEAHADAQNAGESADVFSFGALAYLVFTGRAPAANQDELRQKLQGRGLNVAEAADAPAPSLVELVEWATKPAVIDRIDSVRFAIGLLDKVEDELTTPDAERDVDPRDARQGQVLGGCTVRKRLGEGASAVAYLVERGGKKVVLKLALTPEQNGHLRDEAEVIGKLRDHERLVEFHDTVEVQGRLGLILSYSGDKTLRDRLRRDGRLALDLLARWGEDLLLALKHIDGNGIAHRDIKPENLGVCERGVNDELHLVLFDFSLSRAPREKIHAGTPGYVDPFLTHRKPPRWDESAERFSAAVVLYEMATGTLPRWGDGRSDPASIEEEVTVESDLLEGPVREPLKEFFTRALRRDPKARFDTPDDMLREWKEAFEDVTRSPGGPELLDAAAVEAALRNANPTTPLTAIPFGALVQGAFERLAVATIGEALALPAVRFHKMRGVGNQTKRDVLGVLERLMARFPDSERASPGGDDPPSAVRGKRRKPTTEDEAELEPGVDPATVPLDRLVQRLHPREGKTKADTRAREAVRFHLGLDPLPGPTPTVWASQTDIGTQLGVTRARIAQILQDVRIRWAKLKDLSAVRDLLVELTAGSGGLTTVAELEHGLFSRRTSPDTVAPDFLLVRAVVRAALDMETTGRGARLAIRRGTTNLVAVDGAQDGGADAEAILDYGRKLADTADRLAVVDPLPAPGRVESDLRAVPVPEGFLALATDRLVRFAALASQRAAASSRLELYPRGLPPERALALARGALAGARDLRVDDVRQRVAARYPEAVPLPPRPALDALLEQAGLDLRWVEEQGKYQLRTVVTAGLSSGSTVVPRLPTGTGAAPLEITPELADARLLEERLARAAREGSFLVLTVEPKHHERAASELARFGVERVSLEARLIHHLHAAASRRSVQWPRVIEADAGGAEGTHWSNLQRLVREALDAVVAELLARRGVVLLTEAGLLARYDRLDVIETLRDRTGTRTGSGDTALQGVWILIDQDVQQTRPALDGKTVAVLGGAQWTRLPDKWLENEHRAVGAGSTKEARA